MFTAPLMVTALATPFSRRTRRHPPVERGYRRILGALIVIRPGLDTPPFDATGWGLILPMFFGSEFRDLSNFDAETFGAGFGGDNERLHCRWSAPWF